MFTRSIIRKLLPAAASAMMLSSVAVAGVSASDIIKGDINCDGNVDYEDLTFMSRYLSGKERIYRLAYYNGDMDNDGNVDAIDLIKLRKMLGQEKNVPETDGKISFASDSTSNLKELQIIDATIENAINSPFDNLKHNSANADIDDAGLDGTDDEFIKAPLSEMYRTLPSEGEGKVCIFYVDFPDCPYEYVPTRDEMRTMAFADEEPESKHYPFESINAFYRRSSKHQVTLSGEIFRYTTKHNKEYYENDVYKMRLIDELVDSLDDTVNFREFDGNKDGVIDSMLISVPEAAGNDHWWPCAGRYAGCRSEAIDGVSIGKIVVGNAEIKSCTDYDRFVGSYIHELGHCMGLPDYYLYEQSGMEGLHGSAGFDTMDELYADFSSASKLMLGWYRKSQIQVYDYNGEAEQTFTLTDGQTENGNCLIIPYQNELADDYCSEYLLLEYTTLNNNNKEIPNKYWSRNYGSGIRVLHVNANTEIIDGMKDLMFKSGKISYYEYYFGRRFVRVINDSNIDNLYRTGRVINDSIDGFGFYNCTGTMICDPGVEVYVGELEGDSYKVTVRRKG